MLATPSKTSPSLWEQPLSASQSSPSLTKNKSVLVPPRPVFDSTQNHPSHSSPTPNWRKPSYNQKGNPFFRNQSLMNDFKRAPILLDLVAFLQLVRSVGPGISPTVWMMIWLLGCPMNKDYNSAIMTRKGACQSLIKGSYNPISLKRCSHKHTRNPPNPPKNQRKIAYRS